jgi:hypothetical protein
MCPIIDLQTNLKSLGYGNDRPGGASSNQPYIVTPIPEGEFPKSPDFLLRNGVLNPETSLTDVKRIGKFFTNNRLGNLNNIDVDINSINGLLFVTKQELLERQNVDVVDGINRIYNPLSTLAQVGVVADGYHLNKQGINPFRRSYFKGGEGGYFKTTQFNNDIDINRLSGLLYIKKLNKSDILSKEIYSISSNPNELTSYSGGPGSILGIGKTNIRIWNNIIPFINSRKDLSKAKFVISNSDDFQNPNYLVPTGKPSISWYYNPIGGNNLSNEFAARYGINNEELYGSIETSAVLNNTHQPLSSSLKSTTPYSSIIKRSKLNVESTTTLAQIKDFRLDTEAGKNNQIPTSNYPQFNRENQIDVNGNGNQGYGTSVTTYKGNVKNGQRVINPNIWISQDQNEKGVNGEDIIDFNFRILSPDNGDRRLIDFREYLESWSDGVKADWNSVKYMGRAEEFYKYGGFSRDASISFLVPALSRGDMIANYRKVNALMWSVAPSYSPKEGTVSGLMRGSITEVTMGSYFRSMPSIIRSVEIAEIEGIGWDINRKIDGTNISVANADNENPFVGQLPKGLKITVSFTPLHNFVPQYGEAFIGQSSIYSPPKYNTRADMFSDDASKSIIEGGVVNSEKPNKLSTISIQDTAGEGNIDQALVTPPIGTPLPSTAPTVTPEDVYGGTPLIPQT